ncbi:DNA-processing protein DprA [Sphingobacterium haloxyli]|uniref:DNA-protecting protein DprA n=1 Tax=Sphingobacterium haloxyli TaxID=2100533 RepID=A0A2S9J380_9SPHI|nr:DNA-processing protein DprA [Sphingobacterium haloxyli]PRD47237.1 DNA-protecting protein DprA [Sphingobacterium haloxyli]
MTMLKKIALTKIKGVGPKTARTLLACCGSIDNIFDASKKQLLSIPGIGNTTVESILSKNYMHDAERELAFVEKHNVEILWAEDANYPRRLKQCEDAPLLIYYKGTVDLNPSLCVSIVGTRNATAYGKRICEELISTLQGYDMQIISGLAYGIDVQAHRLAIKHHIPTIGVLGHGLDRIYPSAHRDIASRMLENGGLLTEYPSETIPDRNNFPARNRIIAGLADVTIVVEAAKKGGALITAEIANSYNRDVCAFPGGVDQEYSAGCNYLIKTHRAHLIRHADDLIYLMGWEQPKPKQEGVQLPLLTNNLSKNEQRVYDFLRERQQASVDEIALHLGWPTSKLAIILLEMEMNNILLSLPGKIYRIC